VPERAEQDPFIPQLTDSAAAQATYKGRAPTSERVNADVRTYRTLDRLLVRETAALLARDVEFHRPESGRQIDRSGAPHLFQGEPNSFTGFAPHCAVPRIQPSFGFGVGMILQRPKPKLFVFFAGKCSNILQVLNPFQLPVQLRGIIPGHSLR
jgi:hypothetical protein